MKYSYRLLILFCFFSSPVFAQNEVHSTMFMFNKLLYNPAYTGSRDITSFNAYYRDQWNNIKGAPKSYGVTFDAPVGNYNQSFREIALGLSFVNEQIDIERKQDIVAYYSYRIKMKNESVLSLGLDVGTKLYSANYSLLNPYQQNDPNLAKDINSVSLPNFGAGFFWRGENYYIGAAVPNIIQNYYDKNEKNLNNRRSQEVRGYYASGGYVFHVNESFAFLSQGMARYSGNGTYQLPFNCDINLSFIMLNRLLLGFTYRTDKSIEGIMHMQVTRTINIGYSYDYLMSALSGYDKGAHELVIGFGIDKSNSREDKPHFIKLF